MTRCPMQVGGCLVLAFLLSACASTYDYRSDDPQLTPLQRMSQQECEETEAIRGWNACSRHAAEQAYEYALMSSNAYDVDTFELGDRFQYIEHEYEQANGFGYVLYERRLNGETTEVIIAFRGTDFTSGPDWWHGNLLTGQRRSALALFDDVSDRYDLTPSVTGHSLGGALATQVSLCRDVHLSVVFDSSPRFSKGLCEETYLNRNFSIVEFGEINYILRLFGREADQLYTSLNCTSEGGAVTQHSMQTLASCLTSMAALDSELAQAIADLNAITPPDHWHAAR